MADLDRKEAVGDEIVEFEHVADGGGKRSANDVDVLLLVNHASLWQPENPKNLPMRLNIGLYAGFRPA